MNNLKFRAYFEQYKRMIENIGIVNNEMILVDFIGDGNLEPIFITGKIHVMQFTGLFDKSGKEIFEGDIVRNIHTKKIGKVFWDVHNAGFYYNVKRKGSEYLSDSYTIFRSKHNLEIIGNIYEDDYFKLLEEN